jgi:hypothetical protein
MKRMQLRANAAAQVLVSSTDPAHSLDTNSFHAWMKRIAGSNAAAMQSILGSAAQLGLWLTRA